MSMIAIGSPTFSRPGASLALSSGTLSTFQGSGARRLQRLSAPGQARSGHKILFGVERVVGGAGLDPLARARAQSPPALLVVEEIRHHDLIEHLLVHGGVEDREERLEAGGEGGVLE